MADRFTIGRVRGAHGIRGEVKVETFDPSSDAIRKGTSVWLGAEEAPRRVLGVRVHGPAVLVFLEGVATRNDAEALIGRELSMERTALPALEEGEFYLADVEGFAVRTVAGEEVGTVEGTLGGSAQEILRVRGTGPRDGKSLLIPAVEGLLVEVLADERVVVIDPPEGLLDL